MERSFELLMMDGKTVRNMQSVFKNKLFWETGASSWLYCRNIWIFVCCECCVLSGRGLCDELITCPEESYRVWCVVVCDLETSRMRRPWPNVGCCAPPPPKKKQNKQKQTWTFRERYTTWIAWPLKMRPIGCLETSATNYQSTLRNIPEEWRYERYTTLCKSF